MTLRWVKDSNTKRWHLLERAAVRVANQKAWHLTACGLTVEGRTFRDGFPAGVDCTACLQLAIAAQEGRAVQA